jgi:hypothetical protein
MQRLIVSNWNSTQFTGKTIKHPDSLMVWGDFSAAGPGDLYFMPRNATMNSEMYEKVLENHLTLFLQFHQPPISFGMGALPCKQAKQEVSG